MRVSGAEFLRVSQLRPGGTIPVMDLSGSSTVLGSLATSPLRPSPGGQGGTEQSGWEEARGIAEKVEELPEIREDVVASLRARIESGGYIVSGEQIAEMMVRRLLADRVR